MPKSITLQPLKNNTTNDIKAAFAALIIF